MIAKNLYTSNGVSVSVDMSPNDISTFPPMTSTLVPVTDTVLDSSSIMVTVLSIGDSILTIHASAKSNCMLTAEMYFPLPSVCWVSFFCRGTLPATVKCSKQYSWAIWSCRDER